MALNRVTSFTTDGMRDLRNPNADKQWLIRFTPLNSAIHIELVPINRADASFSVPISKDDFRQLAVALLGPSTELNAPLKVIEQATEVARPRGARRRHGMSVIETIMSHFTPHGVFTAARAGDWIEKAGYLRQSASAALAELKRLGCIEPINGRGNYRFRHPLNAPAKEAQS